MTNNGTEKGIRGFLHIPPKRYIKELNDQKHPLLQDDQWHLWWSVMLFVYAVIATSEPETTVDESHKVYILRNAKFRASLSVS